MKWHIKFASCVKLFFCYLAICLLSSGSWKCGSIFEEFRFWNPMTKPSNNNKSLRRNVNHVFHFSHETRLRFTISHFSNHLNFIFRSILDFIWFIHFECYVVFVHLSFFVFYHTIGCLETNYFLLRNITKSSTAGNLDFYTLLSIMIAWQVSHFPHILQSCNVTWARCTCES